MRATHISPHLVQLEVELHRRPDVRTQLARRELATGVADGTGRAGHIDPSEGEVGIDIVSVRRGRSIARSPRTTGKYAPWIGTPSAPLAALTQAALWASAAPSCAASAAFAPARA